MAVADLAIERTVRSLQREGLIVVEGRSLPTIGRRAVARLAVGRESRLLVVRIGGGVIVRSVAVDAARWGSRVLAIRMTQAAIGDPVLTVERPHQVVIEGGSQPARGGNSVAGLTVGRETRLLVVRIVGGLIVGQVAAGTGRGRSRVLAIRMTQAAIGDPVLTVERPHQVVIEGGSQPARGGGSMAGLTVGREPGRCMVGVGRPLVIRQVAAGTGRRRSRVLAIRMTQAAINRGVLPTQRKYQIVIEGGSLPARGGGSMAGLTVGWEPGLLMIRIRRL